MNVFLVDDHEIFRLGLRSLLESETDITVTGEADCGEAGLKDIESSNPDIVVLDYVMPGKSGLEVLEILRRRHPSISVILLTASKSESILTEAINSGAQGVILKQDTSKELVQTVKTVHEGEKAISSSILPLLERADVLEDLTKREKQVLRMIAGGYRNREIADDLNISMKTVDTHRTNLMRKLNLHSVVDVVDFANKAGLIDPTI